MKKININLKCDNNKKLKEREEKYLRQKKNEKKFI